MNSDGMKAHGRDDAVILLLLGMLFPEWNLSNDTGVWQAQRGNHILYAGSADELIEKVYEVDPEAIRRAAEPFQGPGKETVVTWKEIGVILAVGIPSGFLLYLLERWVRRK